MKKYGKGYCGNQIRFPKHWEDGADQLKKETNFSTFLFEIEHIWKGILNNLLVISPEDKDYYYDNWKK